MARRLGPISVAILGAALMAAIAVRVIAEVDWDATIFVAFGEEATPTREYAEERIGELVNHVVSA